MPCWGMMTTSFGLPSCSPAGQSVGVDGMEAHAGIMGAWPEFLLIDCEFPAYITTTSKLNGFA